MANTANRSGKQHFFFQTCAIINKYFSLMFQGIVRSVEMARIMCCRENHNSLLIGARNRVMELTTNNLEKISASLSLCQTEVSRVSSVSKKYFLRNLGYEGTVLASKDSIIVSLHGTETVVLIDRFLSVRCKEQW